MNKIMLTGNLTRDPETRQTKDGDTVTNFDIAVNRAQAAGKEQMTDYFTITTWGTLADACGKFLSKGNKVLVEGSMQSSKYIDKQGVNRTAWEVVAKSVEFLTPKKEPEEEKPAAQKTYRR